MTHEDAVELLLFGTREQRIKVFDAMFNMTPEQRDAEEQKLLQEME